MIIKVVGTGCAKCTELEDNVKSIVAANGINATVEKVSDLQQIMELGIISTPGIVVDDNVVCTGRIPSNDEILAWIKK